jgi:hypothetical protein
VQSSAQVLQRVYSGGGVMDENMKELCDELNVDLLELITRISDTIQFYKTVYDMPFTENELKVMQTALEVAGGI